jgi:hypothetical protein
MQDIFYKKSNWLKLIQIKNHYSDAARDDAPKPTFLIVSRKTHQGRHQYLHTPSTIIKCKQALIKTSLFLLSFGGNYGY